MNIKNLLKLLKLNESSVSMLLGALVVVAIGFLVVNFFRNRGQGPTPTTTGGQAAVTPVQEGQVPTNLPKTHTVAAGEHLWGIAEQYFSSGFNWVDIAEANSLGTPNLLEVGQELSIPEVPAKAITISVPIMVGSTYKAVSGDSLWSVAERAYSNPYAWMEIAKANNLSKPYLLEMGQEISIPAVSDAQKSQTETKPDVSGSIIGDSYVVATGDHLWAIAVRAYGDGFAWVKIAQENNLSNPNVIEEGQELKLPR